MHEQYNPQLIEQQLQQEWEQTNAFKVVEDASKKNTTASPCSRTQVAVYIWATCVTTP